MAQEIGSKLEAPAREVLHRRLTNERGKAFGERRAREPYATRQFVHCPCLGRLRVHERIGAALAPIVN